LFIDCGARLINVWGFGGNRYISAAARPNTKRYGLTFHMSMPKEEQQRTNIRPTNLGDGRLDDTNMWLFEHYRKEHLRSIGVVE